MLHNQTEPKVKNQKPNQKKKSSAPNTSDKLNNYKKKTLANWIDLLRAKE